MSEMVAFRHERLVPLRQRLQLEVALPGFRQVSADLPWSSSRQHAQVLARRVMNRVDDTPLHILEPVVSKAELQQIIVIGFHRA